MPRSRWPNEQFRTRGWIGAKTYESANVESFLDAFYGLRAWDNWDDPNYLDAMLISPAKKPTSLIYRRAGS